MTIEYTIDLSCHPSTRMETVRAIRVRVRRQAEGAGLAVSFCLEGDIARIRMPSPGAPRIAAQLWQHTCFEVFVAIEGLREYHELNFAPSSEWAAYSFRGYRDGSPFNEMRPPQITMQLSDHRLELDTVVLLDDFSAIHPRASLKLGLSAVIEHSDGTLSYWALHHHSADKPDFHAADAFALRLEAPSS